MKLETRVAPEMKISGRKLEGYAALFHSEAKIADFREIIAPGAFTRTLRDNKDIVALQDHDAKRLLGRTSSGTLKLTEDARGLSFSIDVPDTAAGRDVLALAERGDIGGMSFGFRVPKDGERWDGNKRTLSTIDLVEVSVVSAFPAYSGTSCMARSQGDPLMQRVREIIGGAF